MHTLWLTIWEKLNTLKSTELISRESRFARVKADLDYLTPEELAEVSSECDRMVNSYYGNFS